MQPEQARIKRFLSIGQVCSQTTLGKSCIYDKIKSGEFPKPRQLTVGRVGWLQEDVSAWIESRPTAALDDVERRPSAA